MRDIIDVIALEGQKQLFEAHIRKNCPTLRTSRWGESYRSVSAQLAFMAFQSGLTVGLRIGSKEIEVPESLKPANNEMTMFTDAIPSVEVQSQEQPK
jgi:hypothetical protein